MNGRIWVGRASMAAGRAGEAPSTGLTEMLVGLGFETDRLKTGTPARVDSRTVNFKGLEEQPGEQMQHSLLVVKIRLSRCQLYLR
jgi:tRNA uridine 5-carboxymethylaminomethyl modification enzyme